MKKMTGIIICIGGVVLLLISHYIEEQVAEGQERISNAESSVSQGKKLFGINPYSKAIGEEVIIRPSESKISAGKEEASYYEGIGKATKVGGIVLFSIGIIALLFPYFTKKKKR